MGVSHFHRTIANILEALTPLENSNFWRIYPEFSHFGEKVWKTGFLLVGKCSLYLGHARKWTENAGKFHAMVCPFSRRPAAFKPLGLLTKYPDAGKLTPFCCIFQKKSHIQQYFRGDFPEEANLSTDPLSENPYNKVIPTTFTVELPESPSLAYGPPPRLLSRLTATSPPRSGGDLGMLYCYAWQVFVSPAQRGRCHTVTEGQNRGNRTSRKISEN